LYRDPVEVMVSQMRQRGAQMIPGAVGQLLPGIDVEETLSMPAEEYCARVLGRFCESALEHAAEYGAEYGTEYGADKKNMLVNYSQLPEAIADLVPEHFGVSYSPEEIEKMKVATQFDAKTPRVNFKPDSKEKKDRATDAIRKAAAKWIEPAYEKLEAIRNGNVK
jgi:hypothetical protein